MALPKQLATQILQMAVAQSRDPKKLETDFKLVTHVGYPRIEGADGNNKTFCDETFDDITAENQDKNVMIFAYEKGRNPNGITCDKCRAAYLHVESCENCRGLLEGGGTVEFNAYGDVWVGEEPDDADDHNSSSNDEEDEDEQDEDEEETDDEEDEQEDDGPSDELEDTEHAANNVVEADFSQEDEETMANNEEKKTEELFTIQRGGDKVVIPEGASPKSVIASIRHWEAQETTMVDLVYRTKMTVPDGVMSFLRVMRERFGFINMENAVQGGFFGTFETPPSFLSVETGPGKKESVPWGSISIPAIEKGSLQMTFYPTEAGPLFQVSASVMGKHRKLLDSIMEDVESGHKSIYRGQAVKLHMPDPTQAKNVAEFFPTFLDLPAVEVKPIFNRDIEGILNTTLFVPIEHSSACRRAGIKLKRGILLDGPFGTGKTLTALATAQKCVENGWTFVYAEKATDFKAAYEFAMRHQPAVLFTEDVDTAFEDDEDREEEVKKIQNTLDGIESKDLEVVTVLTTNHLGDITKAMLRPGRIDVIVPVVNPDEETAQRLVRAFAGSQLASFEDLSRLGPVLAGLNPPMIKEIVDRSKLAAIGRTGSSERITAADILAASGGAKEHMELISDDEDDGVYDDPQLEAANILGKHISNAIGDVTSFLLESKDEEATNGNGSSTHREPVKVVEQAPGIPAAE